MGVSLKKGQGVSLRKEENDLNTLTMGLGWDVATPKRGLLGSLFGKKEEEYDLDAIAFLLDENRKVVNFGREADGKISLQGGDLVFFNSMKHPSGKVWLTGDNRTGAGDGDDEQIIVKLNELPACYHSIVFMASIYQGKEKGQNFGKIENCFIRAVDGKNKEIARYDISGNDSYSQYHAITFAEVVRDGNSWKFDAIGTPHTDSSIVDLLRNYLDQ